MKVGVFAGTPVDTKMGVEILEKRGFKTLSFPLAKNPLEQSKMQYFSKEKLEELVLEKILEGKSKGMEKAFIYCNSLSGAIDYEKIGQEGDMDIITPLETYKNLHKDIKNVAILAANGISAYKIDSIITQENPDIRTISMGNLALVESIEEKLSPREIIENLNLEGLFKYFENIKDKRYKIDCIILGCTHFPYLIEELKKITDINIIDPAEDMISRLMK